MSNKKIGVFICHCGSNIAGTVDIQETIDFSLTLPNVVLCKDYKFMCSDPGQDLIKADIKAHELDAVVIAACSPLMHERTFRNAIAGGGLNPYLVQIANIREQGSWVTEDKALATEKAKAFIAGAVMRVAKHQPLTMRKVSIQPAAMVVGGGVAGIQAALDLADAGTKVTLVERQASIGGYMAMFDKTFPTLDCSACILTPKMTSVGRHPNIRLMTYSEVEEVSGFVGNFNVKVKRKAAYVNHEKCTGCGVCMEKCPIKVPSEFDQGLSQRRAIYVPFAQAVPNKPVIDPNTCVRFSKGKKCNACSRVCEPGAIDFEQKDIVEDISVGAIVVSTGFEPMEMKKIPELGYGKLPEVYTALEFERLNNSAGPTLGVIRTKDGRTPQSVAILHCTGSRDENFNKHCSRVCCMYALKYAHLIKEKLPQTTVFSFYIDMRCFGKGFEEFYQRLQHEGVKFIRGKAARVYGGSEYKILGTNFPLDGLEDQQLVVQAEDTLLGKLLRVPVDMVVLTPAIEARADADEVGRKFLLSRGADGFFIEQHPKLAPVNTTNEGVFIAGVCQGPKDIPDTVAQASAAAGKALSLISRGEVEVEGATAFIVEELCSGCKSCLDICPYKAITFSEENKKSTVNEVLCKGCGTCVATCPSAAITALHFTDEQIFAEIEGVMMV